MCKTVHWMSISSLSSKRLLILSLCSCTSKLGFLFHVKMRVFRQIFLESQSTAEIWYTLKCTFTGLGLKTLTGDSFWTSPFAQQINAIIFAPSPKITKPKQKRKRKWFLFTVWHTALRCSMTSRRLGNEGSLRACKQICACYFLQHQDQIFGARCSQFPCGSLWGVVFHVSFFAVR